LRIQFGGIPALPTSFIIDAQGRVVQKHIGLRDPVLYETEIRALLGLPINARVETFVDAGEVFLKHADRASELPGVDMTQLTAAQKTVALHRMNQESCTCGCKYTLAQCRIFDEACQTSQKRTAKIVVECAAAGKPVGSEQPPPKEPASSAPNPPTDSNASPAPPSRTSRTLVVDGSRRKNTFHRWVCVVFQRMGVAAGGADGGNHFWAKPEASLPGTEPKSGQDLVASVGGRARFWNESA
jgi:hypothetical protein